MMSAQPRDLDMGIVVRDLETMTRFYTEGLGFEHVSDRPTAAVSGLLRRFECEGAYVKFLQLGKEPNLSSPPGGARGDCSGLRWFSLTVDIDEIEQVWERCKALGATEVTPLQDTGDGRRYMVIEDPERNWFEVLGADRSWVRPVSRDS